MASTALMLALLSGCVSSKTYEFVPQDHAAYIREHGRCLAAGGAVEPYQSEAVPQRRYLCEAPPKADRSRCKRWGFHEFQDGDFGGTVVECLDR